MYNYRMDLTPHRQEIAHRLKALEAAIGRLVDSLSQGNFPAQIQDATTSSAVRKICAAYSTIDYGMKDEIPPATVTYTRANTRAVYRKSVEEIAEMLQNLNSPAAILDRERLATLDRRVTHLALVKERHQNIRASILYPRLDPKGRGRIQICAELPLIYATGARRGRRTESPEVHFPASDDAPQPARTRKTKLEAEPFLRVLLVYRYRQ
jgi:hypothetical protein